MQRRSKTRFVRRIEGLLVCFGTLGSASAPATELGDCKALVDDVKRLACYDSVSGQTVTTPDREMPKVVEKIQNDVSGIGLVAKQPVDTTRAGAKASSLVERWDLDGRPSPSLFALRPYKPIYILPAFYSSSPNLRPSSPNPDNNGSLSSVDHLEGKFQYSMKAKVLENLGVTGGSLWFAFTQSSRWQVYNKETSRNFRETDYEPEIIYSAPTNYSLLGLDGRLIGLSLTHQSNGRDLPLSRSWNRVIGQVGLENADWTVLVRPWLRLREKASRDDNPDILDYMGRGEVIAIRKFGNQQVAVTLRHSLRGGSASHGSVGVDWSFPLFGYLKGHVQGFSGYGESLIDYNRRQNSLGVGISLEEWL